MASRKKTAAKSRKRRKSRSSASLLNKELEKMLNSSGKDPQPVLSKEAIVKSQKFSRKKPEVVHQASPKRIAQKAVTKRMPKDKIVQTGIDSLHKTVVSRGSLTVEEASSMLKVPVSKIVEWSNILEDHKLIRMKYPKFGKPHLVRYMETAPPPKTQASKTDKPKKKPPKKRIALLGVLVIILFSFILRDRIFGAFQGFNPQEYQAYLIAIAVIIIIIVLLVAGVAKKRRKVGKLSESKK